MEEVFRISPQTGKHYETAEYVEKREGKYYCPKNMVRYVGKFTHTERFGAGDGQEIYEVFELSGKRNMVAYTYEGTTCFREVPEPLECVHQDVSGVTCGR